MAPAASIASPGGYRSTRSAGAPAGLPKTGPPRATARSRRSLFEAACPSDRRGHDAGSAGGDDFARDSARRMLIADDGDRPRTVYETNPWPNWSDTESPSA